jgi:hypothetical protein
MDLITKPRTKHIQEPSGTCRATSSIKYIQNRNFKMKLSVKQKHNCRFQSVFLLVCCKYTLSGAYLLNAISRQSHYKSLNFDDCSTTSNDFHKEHRLNNISSKKCYGYRNSRPRRWCDKQLNAFTVYMITKLASIMNWEAIRSHPFILRHWR